MKQDEFFKLAKLPKSFWPDELAQKLTRKGTYIITAADRAKDFTECTKLSEQDLQLALTSLKSGSPKCLDLAGKNDAAKDCCRKLR